MCAHTIGTLLSTRCAISTRSYFMTWESRCRHPRSTAPNAPLRGIRAYSGLSFSSHFRLSTTHGTRTPPSHAIRSTGDVPIQTPGRPVLSHYLPHLAIPDTPPRTDLARRGNPLPTTGIA